MSFLFFAVYLSAKNTFLIDYSNVVFAVRFALPNRKPQFSRYLQPHHIVFNTTSDTRSGDLYSFKFIRINQNSFKFIQKTPTPNDTRNDPHTHNNDTQQKHNTHIT